MAGFFTYYERCRSKMKKSNYNIFVPYDDTNIIVFNSFSGAIGLFSTDTKTRFDNNILNPDEIVQLQKKGILIPDDFSEIDQINADRIEGITNANVAFFRIWTTSACNANCFYCFERGISPVSMTRETADQLIRFIDSHSRTGMRIELEWFGGEPLCNTDIIDYITAGVKEICQSKNISYIASMISNGSLIDESIASKMETEWNVKSVQITLDGDELTYNRIKDYNNKNIFNFRRVVAGIKLLSSHNIHVSIRMNYTTDNFDSLMRLIDYLHKEFSSYKNIFYYPYPIWDSLNSLDSNAFVSSTHADDNILRIFDKLVTYKMSPAKQLFRLKYKKRQCASCCENGFSIFPDGKLGKCSETFTQPIGDIWNGIQDFALSNKWTNTGLDTHCRECVYLPICQGGCRASQVTTMPQCFAYKEIVPDILRWYVHYLQSLSQK